MVYILGVRDLTEGETGDFLVVPDGSSTYQGGSGSSETVKRYATVEAAIHKLR